MLHILLGSLMLSLIHAAIPNHWLPLVVISKAQRWSHAEALAITALTGAAHASSTILIGIFVGLLGQRLAADSRLVWLVPGLLLLGLGIAYLVLDLRGHSSHEHIPPEATAPSRSPTAALVLSLSAAMFLSPCIEIEAYYLQGGAYGWTGVALISLLYLAVTVLGMVVLVHLALRGARRIRSRYLEHHERQASGLVLLALGLFTLLVHP
ncbi:MAG: hypothetical protein D6815_09860 [Candidatus Dadabacteria bacterium]|nr:MAG: hypothetical protein D6815_09860 [Candidatus Dadabacteria bacterium]